MDVSNFTEKAKQLITSASNITVRNKNEEIKGCELWAMIEGQVADENVYIGRTYRDAPDVDGYVFIHTDKVLITGDFVKVKITGAYEYDLIGEIAE